MLSWIPLAADAKPVEARAVHVIEFSFHKGRFLGCRVSVDSFPGGDRGEGEFVGRDTKDRACNEFSEYGTESFRTQGLERYAVVPYFLCCLSIARWNLPFIELMIRHSCDMRRLE